MRTEINGLLSSYDKSWFNLIDRYIAIIDSRPGQDTDNMDYTKLKTMLIDYKILVQRKNVELTDWISVKNALPDEMTMVLIVSIHTQFSQVSTGFLDEGLWIDGMPGSGLRYLQQDLITHWMPFPEPPQTE